MARVVVSCIIAFHAACAGLAQTSVSWAGDVAGDWATGANWVGGASPGQVGATNSADVATFDAPLTVLRRITVDATRSVAGITFGNTSNFGYQLATGPLWLANGGSIQNTADNGRHTDSVLAPVVILGDGGRATFAANASQSASLLSITGAISGVSTAGNNTVLTLTGSNVGLNVVGPISNGVEGGTLSVVKEGSGTWQLNSPNTFTGDLTLNAGMLRLVAGANNLLGGGKFHLNGGTLYAGHAAGRNQARETHVGGDATIITDRSTAGAGLTHGLGALFLGGHTLTIRGGDNVTSGTAGYTFTGATTLTGAGTLKVENNASTTTLLTLSGAFDNGGYLATFTGTGNTAVGGAMSGAGGVLKSGNGTLTLRGDNRHTGTTTVTGGTLVLSGRSTEATGAVMIQTGATLAASGAVGGEVSIASGGTLQVVASSPFAVAGLSLADGANFNVGLGAPSMTGVLEVSGDLVLDGTLNLTDTGGFGEGLYRLINYTGALTDNGLDIGATAGAERAKLFIQLSQENQVNLIYGSAAKNFWRGGNGVWTADPAGTAWTDIIGTTTAAWVEDTAIFSGAPGIVTIDTAAGAVKAKGLQFATDGYTLAGGPLTLDNVGSGVRVGDGTALGAGMTATIAAEITGAGGIDKNDLGRLVLSGANTYSGTTTVSAGTLQVDGSQAAATGAVSVARDAVLTGSGTLGGVVTVADGGILRGSAGQVLTVGGLVLNDASMVDVALGAPSESALFQVNGDLTLDGVLNISDAGGFGQGLYRLMNYTGTLTDRGLALGVIAGAPVEQLRIDVATQKQVNLLWTAPTAPMPNWAGGSGIWSRSEAYPGFGDGAGATGPWNTGFALFQAPAGTVTIDNSAGAVAITGMQFAASGYVIAGDGLTLADPNTIVRVGDGTAAGSSMSATISAVVSGGGLEKSDFGRLILTATNTYQGGTTVSRGMLEISRDNNLGDASGAVTLNGGTLRTTAAMESARPFSLGAEGGRIETQADLSLSGVISGSGGVEKTGAGRLTLSGANTFTGATVISAGAIHLNGGRLSAATVAAGAALTGNGSVQGHLTNQGRLSPGASPGTVNVSGNYTQGGTGAYDVEIASATSYDKLVVAGSAQLGGTLNVTRLDGFVPQAGQVYTVLSAGAGVSGTFAVMNSDWHSAMLPLSVVYGANQVDLTFTQRAFASLSGGANALAVGAALDQAIAANKVGGLAAALNALPVEADVIDALDALAPVSYGHRFAQAVAHAQANVAVIETHLAEARPGEKIPRRGSAPKNAWFELLRRENQIDAGSHGAGVKAKADGVVAGIDALHTESIKLGLAVTYAEEAISSEDSSLTGSAERIGGIGYARYTTRPVVFDATAGFSRTGSDSQRFIAIPGYAQVANAKADSWEYFASLRLSHAFAVGSTRVAPYAAGHYLNWSGNLFRETGAGDASLLVHEQSGRSLSGRVGVVLSRAFAVRKVVLTPTVDLAWRREFEGDAPEILARLGSSEFSVTGRGLGRDGVIVGAGLNAALGERFAGYAKFAGEWDGATDQVTEVRLGVVYRF